MGECTPIPANVPAALVATFGLRPNVRDQVCEIINDLMAELFLSRRGGRTCRVVRVANWCDSVTEMLGRA